MGEHWMTLVSSCSVCQIPNRNHHESIASYIDLGSQVPARSRSFQVLCLERRFKKEDDVYTRKRSWSRVSRTQVPDVISILRQNTARTWPRESQSLAFSQGFPGQWLQWRSSILDLYQSGRGLEPWYAHSDFAAWKQQSNCTPVEA